ncbi:hypothetical protein BDV11DRAFT_171949 [Aspergillus similis]
MNYVYNGPSDAVMEVTTAAAAQGAILPASAPASNSSWTLVFPVPTLKCSSIEDQTRSEFGKSIANYTFAGSNCAAGPGYLAWAPLMSADSDINRMLPFIPDGNDSYTFNAGLATDRQSGNTATLLVAARALYHAAPWRRRLSDAKLCLQHPKQQPDLRAKSVRVTRFQLVDGTQQVTVNISDIEDTPMPTNPQVEALYSESADQARCDVLNTDGTECTFDPSLLRTLSYQAVMDSFAQLLVGKVSMTQNSNYCLTFNSNTSQHLLAVSPGNTAQLDQLTVRRSLEQRRYSAEATPPRCARDHVPKRYSEFDERRKPTIITILPTTNKRILHHLPEHLCIHRLQTLARLRPGRLFSTLTVVVGLAAVYLNAACYSNNFSTILRISRGVDLSFEIKAENFDGREPVPCYVKEGTVKFVNPGKSPLSGTVGYTPVGGS